MMKQYPHYKDSGVPWLGEIPRGWKAARLKWVSPLQYGQSLSAQEREDGNVPVYGSNGIVGSHNQAISKAPCIIVGRKGSFGKVNFSDVPCFPIDTTYYIDSSTTSHKLRWLYYLLSVLRLDEFSKDSAVPGLNREDAYANVAPLPPPGEQDAIAHFLDEQTAVLDTLIAKKQQLIELLREERTAVINAAVTGQFDTRTEGLERYGRYKDSGIEWIREIPETWEPIKLKYVAHLKSGEAITGSSISETGEYPVYGGNGLRGYTSTYSHEGSFILIGRQGALCGNINYANGKFWASEHAVVATLAKGYEVFWLGELLRAMNLNRYSQSAAQPGLAVDFIENLLIPLPSTNEQIAIASFIRSKTTQIDQSIATIEQQISLLQEYRTALISAAVTGQIDVTKT
jgi:type I restriction enzyme, S subunit